ncbi:MAG: hypothetical protein L0Z70_05080 [Chloroflexi bacterium]|nr:hypothetical protein [Chloroflexota bacterium]
MKKLFPLFMVLVLTLSMASAAMAEVPAPGGPFNSAFSVQNLEGLDALCAFSFYDATGAEAFTSEYTTVEPGDSLSVYVPDLAVSGGSYSAVVSCDRKVAAVSNFSDANSGASYSGVGEAGTDWYAPGIYNDYYDYYSNIVVQNAAGAPVDITVEIFAPGNPVAVATQTETAVPANAAVSFEQEALAGLVANQFYSAKISGTGNIAPVVNIYGKGAVDMQLYSYNAFTSGSTVAYAPVIMNNYYGFNTALTIQNIGGNDADVTVEYTNGFTADYTIAPGAAEAIYTPGVAGLPAGNTLYGATVTSNNAEPLVVLVNESNDYGRAASYSGFSAGSTEVRAPIVMKRYYKYNTSVSCQNVGGADTTMTIAYAGIVATTDSDPVAPGGNWEFYQPTDPALAAVPLNYQTSATITSTEPIVCVVNESMNEPPDSLIVQDQLYAYNGIAP